MASSRNIPARSRPAATTAAAQPSNSYFLPRSNSVSGPSADLQLLFTEGNKQQPSEQRDQHYGRGGPECPIKRRIVHAVKRVVQQDAAQHRPDRACKTGAGLHNAERAS